MIIRFSSFRLVARGFCLCVKNKGTLLLEIGLEYLSLFFVDHGVFNESLSVKDLKFKLHYTFSYLYTNFL